MDLLEKIDMYTWEGDYTNPVNEETAYQKFVKAELKKAGKSLGDMSDEETKEFFNMIDKKWKADDEKKTNEESEKKKMTHDFNDQGHCKKCGCSIGGSTKWKTCKDYKKATKS